MRFDQLEFLKKKMESAAYDTWLDKIENIQDLLRSIASIAECFLGMLMDDMKVKEQDPWEQEVEELSGTLTRSKREEDPEARRREFELEYNKAIEIAKGKDWQHAMFQQYGLRDGKPPTGNDAWVIPYCIDELLKANEELKQDTSKLSLGVQKSNRAFMVALRHWMGKNYNI
jgi:hypothetical protein